MGHQGEIQAFGGFAGIAGGGSWPQGSIQPRISYIFDDITLKNMNTNGLRQASCSAPQFQQQACKSPCFAAACFSAGSLPAWKIDSKKHIILQKQAVKVEQNH